MIRFTTARRSLSVLFPSNMLLTGTRTHLFHTGGVRPYSKETSLPDFAGLQGLSKDQLIIACMDGAMGRLRDRLELAHEKEQLVHHHDAILKEERNALLLAKDTLVREKETLLKTVEAKCRVELELRFYFENYQDLRMQYLRQEDQYNLRGIIEYIASTNSRIPKIHGVQANLTDFLTSKEFARSLQPVLVRLQLRHEDVTRSGKHLYHILSKHCHQHNLKGNRDELVVDTTPGNAQTFAVQDGAVLEAFLHFRLIAYTSVSKHGAIRFEAAGPGQPMVAVELPHGYQRKSWLDRVHNGRLEMLSKTLEERGLVV